MYTFWQNVISDDRYGFEINDFPADMAMNFSYLLSTQHYHKGIRMNKSANNTSWFKVGNLTSSQKKEWMCGIQHQLRWDE